MQNSSYDDQKQGTLSYSAVRSPFHMGILVYHETNPRRWPESHREGYLQSQVHKLDVYP